jgi:hypothetical protein
MSHNLVIPVYESHPGTIRISGSTESKKAAACALHYLAQGVDPIDFFYVGANAGQQAMKAMGIFRYTFERSNDKFTLLFQPNRVQTPAKVRQDSSEETLIDACYWRAYPISLASLPPVGAKIQH